VVLGAVLIIAGAGKLALSGSDSQHETIWSAFSARSPTASLVLAGAECVLGGWVLTGVRRHWAMFCAFCLFAAFSGILARELTLVRPRICGCTGWALGEPYLSVKTQLGIGLGLNVLLGVLCIVAVKRRESAVRAIHRLER